MNSMHFRMNLICFILCLLSLQGIDTDHATDGEIFLQHSTAFSLLGRPYAVKTRHIFYQTYNITAIYKSFKDRNKFLNTVENVCNTTLPAIFSRSIKYEPRNRRSLTTLEEKTTEEMLYNFRYGSEYHPVIARKICEEENMTLPEPLDDKEVKALAYYLNKKNIGRAALGVTRGIDGKLEFVHAGEHISLDRYPNITISVTGDLAAHKGNMKEQFNFLLTRRVYWCTLVVTKQAILQFQCIHENAVPIVCQVIPKFEPRLKKSILKPHRDYTKAIDLCKMASKHFNATRTRQVNRFKRILDLAGFTLTDQVEGLEPMTRLEKRMIWIALAKSLSFIPGLVYDMYKDYMMNKKISAVEADVAEIAVAVKKQATTLESIKIDIDNLRSIDQNLKDRLDYVEENVETLFDMNVAMEVVQEIIMFHDEVSAQTDDALNQLQDIVNILMQSKVPLPTIAKLKEYSLRRDLPKQAFVLSPDKPIGLDPEVKNGQIGVFATFLEGDTKWDMYQVIPIPYFVKNKKLVRRIPYNYVLVDNQRINFAAIHEQDVALCIEGVCPLRHVIESINSDPCGVRAMVLKPEVECAIDEEPSSPFFMQATQGLIYSVPTTYRGRLACQGELDKAGMEGTYDLKGQGILVLPSGCDLVVHDHKVIIHGPPQEIFRKVNGLTVTISEVDEDFWNQKKSELEERPKIKEAEMKKEIGTTKVIAIVLGSIAVALLIIGLSPIIWRLFHIRGSFERLKERLMVITHTLGREVHRLAVAFHPVEALGAIGEAIQQRVPTPRLQRSVKTNEPTSSEKLLKLYPALPDPPTNPAPAEHEYVKFSDLRK